MSQGSEPARKPKGPRNPTTLIYSLVMAISGLALSFKVPDPKRSFILSTSAALLLLNLPFIPGNFLWRFDLMTAVLAPIVVGAIVGEIEDYRTALVISLLVFGLILPLSISQMNAIRPSIPPEELQEVKAVVERFSGYTLVCPHPKLLYWVQTLNLDAVRRLEDASPPALIITEKRGPRFHGKVLFDGRYIAVIEPTSQAGPVPSPPPPRRP